MIFIQCYPDHLIIGLVTPRFIISLNDVILTASSSTSRVKLIIIRSLGTVITAIQKYFLLYHKSEIICNLENKFVI